MSPIGVVRSPYQEKFAIPRQPDLAPSATGYCELYNEAAHPDAVRGLEEFSHIWILFEFHKTKAQGWQPLVRPPRLGGNQKVGVFASRSTFRPNAIGMSLVKVVAVEHAKVDGKPCNRITVSGLDLVDGTPIFDIKPYLPYSDSRPEAQASYASEEPSSPLNVIFSGGLEAQLSAEFKQLIIEVLQQDPRPAYQHGKISDRSYGVLLNHHNIRFCYPEPELIEVIAIEPDA